MIQHLHEIDQRIITMLRKPAHDFLIAAKCLAPAGEATGQTVVGSLGKLCELKLIRRRGDGFFDLTAYGRRALKQINDRERLLSLFRVREICAGF